MVIAVWSSSMICKRDLVSVLTASPITTSSPLAT
jgi:hypothetical protein